MGRRAATWAFVTQCFSARNPYPAPGPDLDECRVRNLCQHACRNTEGSYQCLCPAGYRLLPSGKNCQGEQEGASLTQSALSSPLSTISCDGGAGRGYVLPSPTQVARARAAPTIPAGAKKLLWTGSEHSWACVPGQLASPLCVSASWRGGAHTAPPINVWMRRVAAEPMLSKAAAAGSRREAL